MAEERTYYVYILTNKAHGTLYVGVTRSLYRRIWQHRNGVFEGFTSRYGLKRLVYFEDFGDVRDAIARETQIKGWVRRKKIALVTAMNSEWRDLAATWYD